MSKFLRVLEVVRLRSYLLLGCILTAVYLLNRGLVGHLSFDMISVITFLAILVGLRRYRPEAVVGWYVLAAAMLFFTTAGVIQDYYFFHEHTLAPVRSIYQAVNISGYAFLIVGFGILIKRRVHPTKEGMLDVLIFMFGLGSAIGVLIILPILDRPGLSRLPRAVAVTYPIADVLLLALLAFFLLARCGRSVAVSLLTLAVTSALIVDIATALSVQLAALGALHWVAVGYAVALLAFGAAALHPSMVTMSEQPSQGGTVSAGSARLVGIGAALVIGPAELFVQRHIQHRAPDLWTISAVTTVIVALALLRVRYLLKDVQDREERFRSMVQNSSDLILICDPTGRMSYVSPSSIDLMGYDSAALTGSSLIDLIADGDQERIRDVISTLAGRRSVRSVPFEIRHADGTYRSVEAHMANLLANAAVRGFLVNLYDTTGRTVLENELRHAQKLESIGQLASGIAHEINTPIQFVGDNVRFLEDAFNMLIPTDEGERDQADVEFYKAEVPQAIRQTLDGVGRVAEIVRAMKAFGHPGTDDKTFSDLNEAVRNSLVVTNNAVKQYARVETDLHDLPLVRCHIGDINQVLVNLVINAAHAVADQGRQTLGRITVRTRQDANDVVIEVADTGTGIPVEIADRIFEPFFTTKEVGRGTGQGLALAYTLIKDRHGGSITFRSTPGRGTTFSVRLPIDGDTSANISGFALAVPPVL